MPHRNSERKPAPRAKSLARETGLHRSYHIARPSRRPKIEGASRGFHLAKGRLGEINLNTRPITWTPTKIALISFVLGTPYLATVGALIYVGAVGVAMVLLGVLVLGCTLFIGLLLWFDKASF